MTQHTAAHTAGGVEDAVSARLAAAALWALQGPGALDVRTGVVYAPASPMLVSGTVSTSPWTVTVAAGHVVGSKGPTNGPYYAANDGTYTVNLTVPPASNSRIDVIYAMQQDSAAIVNADGSIAAVIAAAAGTPGAIPAVPAIPSGAVALAQVLILSTAVAGTSGAGVTITDVRQFTVTRGAPIPVHNQAERDALWLVDGLCVYRLDLHTIETYNGTTWSRAPGLSHAEFTTAIVGAASGTLYTNPGTLTPVAGFTTDTAFCTAPGTNLTLTDAGTYSVTIVLSCSAAFTGRSLVQINGGPVVMQTNGFAGESGLVATFPNLRTTTGGATLAFSVMQTTGGTANITGRVAVTRIA